jgi:hypothetical protein
MKLELSNAVSPPVTTLIKENEILNRKISQLSLEIDEAKKKIRENERSIWKACEHKWVYDMSCGPYDRTRHQCSVCQLWKNHYWYR